MQTVGMDVHAVAACHSLPYLLLHHHLYAAAAANDRGSLQCISCSAEKVRGFNLPLL